MNILGAITAVAAKADSLVAKVENKDKAIKEKLTEWLNTLYTSDSLHKSVIVLGSLLEGTSAITKVNRYGKNSVTAKVVQSVLSVASIVANSIELLNTVATGGLATSTIYNELNYLCDELKDPNIEGIPIHAEKEIENSDADVAQNLLINQSAGNKEYAVDNVVPKLRTWSIQGYIASNPFLNPLDANLVIKPGLLVQRQLLQYFKDSRKPVLFKTHDNRFFKTLIKHFDTSYVVQSTNALQTTIQLIEFKSLALGEDTLDVISATEESWEQASAMGVIK